MNFRKITTSVVAASIALLGTQAQAGSAQSAGFTVNINLTSACTVAAPSAMTFAYTSMQTSALTASGGTGGTITCTTDLPITSMRVDDGSTVIQAATASYTFGTVHQLSYVLAVSGVPAVATGVAQGYTLSGTMAANQVGKCAVSTCNEAHTRVMFVNF